MTKTLGHTYAIHSAVHMKRPFIIAGAIIGFTFSYFKSVNSPSPDTVTLKEKSENPPQVHNRTKPEPLTTPQKLRTPHKFNVQPQTAVQKVDVVHAQPADRDDAEEPKVERPDDMVYDTTREGIDDAMKAFLPNIRRCYQVARKSNPEMEGRITFAFQISENDDPDNMDIAKVSEVEIFDAEVDSEEMENCIMDNLDELWFDPPEGDPVQVRYPFMFGF